MNTINKTISFIDKPLVNSPEHPWQLKNQRKDCDSRPLRPNKEAYGVSYPQALDIDDVLDDECRNAIGISFVDGAIENGVDEHSYRPIEFNISAIELYL